MDLRIQFEEEQYHVIDWDFEPTQPLASFDAETDAKVFVGKYVADDSALQQIDAKVTEVIDHLANELNIQRYTIADRVMLSAMETADRERPGAK